jgi:hypothetical protein
MEVWEKWGEIPISSFPQTSTSVSKTLQEHRKNVFYFLISIAYKVKSHTVNIHTVIAKSFYSFV